jgi:hypothetical protein
VTLKIKKQIHDYWLHSRSSKILAFQTSQANKEKNFEYLKPSSAMWQVFSTNQTRSVGSLKQQSFRLFQKKNLLSVLIVHIFCLENINFCKIYQKTYAIITTLRIA